MSKFVCISFAVLISLSFDLKRCKRLHDFKILPSNCVPVVWLGRLTQILVQVRREAPDEGDLKWKQTTFRKKAVREAALAFKTVHLSLIHDF